jgi:hypothetical protein
MEVSQIVASLDEEIAMLRQARSLLSGEALLAERSAGNGPFADRAGKKRVMSAEARAKIAAAQRARWAKQKKVAK